MTAQQLQNARASAWRLTGNPLLTAEDAAAWLREAGIALFLPRSAQIAAPTGSLVEATLGEANATPSPAAIESATGLLHRLLAARDVSALNLLGIPGDQPDFLVSEDTLPFLFALRGDREWTRGPRGKSSPLVVEVWKLLVKDGALSAQAITERLGRHLTESAILRALTELWTALRVEPVYSDSEGTRWQLLETNHEQTMIAGSAMAQGMALSALVSLYLQTALAATGEEIEAFLSPVASRSRIRDAVRGLTATRQLGLRNLGPHEHFFVEGSLPEFAEAGTESTGFVSRQEAAHAENKPAAKQPAERGDRQEFDAETPLSDMLPEVSAADHKPEPTVLGEFLIESLSETETERERTMGEGRKRFVAQRESKSGDRRSFGGRPNAPGARPGFGNRPGGNARPGFGARKPFTPREGGPPAKKPFFASEPWKEDARPGKATGAPGERRPFTPREGSERKPFTPREGGRPSFDARKPFAPREGGDRKPFTPREGGERKPFAPREGGRPSFGARKPFTPREGGDRKPFTPREGADRKPFAPREGGRPSFGARKPFTSREGGDRKPFTPREGGDRKAFTPREGSDRKSFTPREGGDRKPFTPREGGDRKPFTPREGGRPSFEARKPFTSREGGSRPAFSDRKPFTPREGGRPSFGGSGGANTPRRVGAEGAAPKRFSPEEGRPSRPGAPAGAGKPGKRPRTAPFTSSGKPRSGVGATGRPGPKAVRPGGSSGNFPPRKPASGRKPGKPFGKGPGKGPRPGPKA